MDIEGALGVALVDWESGMPLGTLGGGKYLDLDLDLAAGGTPRWSGPRCARWPRST